VNGCVNISNIFRNNLTLYRNNIVDIRKSNYLRHEPKPEILDITRICVFSFNIKPLSHHFICLHECELRVFWQISKFIIVYHYFFSVHEGKKSS